MPGGAIVIASDQSGFDLRRSVKHGLPDIGLAGLRSSTGLPGLANYLDVDWTSCAIADWRVGRTTNASKGFTP